MEAASASRGVAQPDDARPQQSSSLNHRVREVGRADHHPLHSTAGHAGLVVCRCEGLNNAIRNVTRCRALRGRKQLPIIKNNRIRVGSANIDTNTKAH